MHLKEIRIENFRNIVDVKLKPSKGLNFFVGENGQGKSNFLEAIYANSRGKSFRSYTQRKDWFAEGSQKSPNVFMMSEDEWGFENQFRLFAHQSATENLIWKFSVNQKAIRVSNLHKKIPMIVFSPDDHELIRGPSEKRREYLDDLLGDIGPGYLEVLERFEKALKERNKVLRRIKTEKEKRNDFKFITWSSEVDTWTKVLAQEGEQLISLRMALWPQLEEKLLTVDQTKNTFEGNRVGAYYYCDPFGKVTQSSIQPTTKQLYDVLKESWPVDVATGWTHRGPQRDDIIITLGDLDGRTRASQGQSRILAFYLKWVHAKWIQEVQKQDPIILIDDFSSELDQKRRSYLLDLVLGSKSQVFLTATELLMVDFKTLSEYTYFKVQKGNFIEENSVPR